MGSNEPLKPKVIPLSGKLILSEDPLSIGENFQLLKNLRYTADHVKGIGGMTKINPTALTNTNKIRSAFHFKKERPVESHLLVQAFDSNVISWSSQNTPVGNGWNGIAWSPQLNLFVAVAGSGTGRVMTSPDGEIWSLQSSAADNVWVDVAWSPELGLFCAVAASGVGDRVMTSPDGVVWTIRTSAADNQWDGIVWSPKLSLFCACSFTGTTNKIMTSPDGVVWTIRVTPNGLDFNDITWSEELGLFVAVGEDFIDGAVITSADGINWTQRSLPSAFSFSVSGVTWSPRLSIFVAVSNISGSNRTYQSSDGITWSSSLSGVANAWSSVTWSPEKSVFVAVSSSGTGDRVMTSLDGSVWISQSSATNNDWTAIAWSPELSIFVAVSSTGSNDHVMTGSPQSKILDHRKVIPGTGDFEVVPLHAEIAPASSGRFSDAPGGNVAYCNSQETLIWGGEQNPIDRFINYDPLGSFLREMTEKVSNTLNDANNEAVLRSVSNITSWATQTSAAGNTWLSIVWSPELSLFVAVSSTGIANRVMTSPDGIAWTARTTPSGAADNDWQSVAWSPQLGLFAAVAATGVLNRVMTSPDGIIWTVRTTPSGDNNWQSVAWSSELGLFCAVAFTGINTRVMTSSDGINWTTRTSAVDNSWSGIVWSPELSLFVAVSSTGIANRVMTSPDGIAWTARTTPSGAADNDWVSVAWSPELSLLVAVSVTGIGNQVMTSSDGIIWDIGVTPLNNNWLSVTWSPELGLFAATSFIGVDTRVMTSPDGIVWTTQTSAADNQWQSVAWSPSLGLFAAVSSSGTATDRVMTSVSDSKMSFLVGSTRTLRGFTLTIKTGNSVAATSIVKYHDGRQFIPVTGLIDGTLSGGKTLAQSGKISFDSTEGLAKVSSIDLTVLYWYELSVALSVSPATSISNITTDSPMQSVKDIWDGTLRSELGFFVFSSLGFNDNTVNVFLDTFDDLNAGTFTNIGGLIFVRDYLLVGFPERQLGLEIHIIGGKGNTGAATKGLVSYWNGADWTELQITDGTKEDNVSFSKSGVITWNPPADDKEFKREINKGVPLFYYKIHFSKTLSANTHVFFIGGIPSQVDIEVFKFPFFADNRLWLCSETKGKKNAALAGANAQADVHNGTDTERFLFGNETELTGAAWLYQQIGADIRSIKLFMKANETWVVDGTTPQDWVKYQLSDKIGCIAPLTIQTVTLGADQSQQVAIWQSSTAIVICDGRSIVPISGDIRQFFDIRDTGSMNFSRISDSVAFIDSEKMEYHWLFSSGIQVLHDREFVYDILRKKWYEIDRATGNRLQFGLTVEDISGVNHQYGTIDTGFLLRLENGDDFIGTAIPHELQTGDIAIEGVLVQTQIRKVKLLQVSKSTTVNNVTVTHFGDASTTGTLVGTFDPTATGKRLSDVKRSHVLGPHVFHSLKATISTNNESIGFEPLVLAVYYKTIRQDINKGN